MMSADRLGREREGNSLPDNKRNESISQQPRTWQEGSQVWSLEATNK